MLNLNDILVVLKHQKIGVVIMLAIVIFSVFRSGCDYVESRFKKGVIAYVISGSVLGLLGILLELFSIKYKIIGFIVSSLGMCLVLLGIKFNLRE